MDPNPAEFPILSYVMHNLPSFKGAADDPPKPQEPHFEISEKMPHLKDSKLISAMRRAVSDVSQTRSVLQALGPRPDHEALDVARSKIAEMNSDGSSEYKAYKAVISLDEMHEAYEKMSAEAERRLERIYVAGVDDAAEVEVKVKEEPMNEEVVAILKEVEKGKKNIEKVDLSGRGLRVLPEAFGTVKSLVVLNLSNNQLQKIPDSITGLENLDELNLSTNLLESLPEFIGLLLKLKTLDVSRNKITSLPDSISYCKCLEEIDASYNKLTYLPTKIGVELVNLKRLSLQMNKLRSLPASVGEMRCLRLLDVHFNELSTIPDSIGKLVNLEMFNLSKNFSDLTELPDTIADLTSLKELDLSNNQIHALPDKFGQLMNLRKLNLEENPMEIPPKEIANGGVEAVKAYMTKRWVDLMMEVEREKKNVHDHDHERDEGLLTRSTSWLKNVATNLGRMGISDNADRYLNEQY
ncbi:hypothetical protein ACS0TY_007148 [Phlomoides rotata]